MSCRGDTAAQSWRDKGKSSILLSNSVRFFFVENDQNVFKCCKKSVRSLSNTCQRTKKLIFGQHILETLLNSQNSKNLEFSQFSYFLITFLLGKCKKNVANHVF